MVISTWARHSEDKKENGKTNAMHKREGYNSNAMNDVTLNIVHGQGAVLAAY